MISDSETGLKEENSGGVCIGEEGECGDDVLGLQERDRRRLDSLFVRALKGKRNELSTPNLVYIYSIAVARNALTQRSKGQRSRSHHGYENRHGRTVASDACCYGRCRRGSICMSIRLPMFSSCCYYYYYYYYYYYFKSPSAQSCMTKIKLSKTTTMKMRFLLLLLLLLLLF